jgi:hypothetical protein
MQRGNSMKAFVLKAALLAAFAVSPAYAQSRPRSTPDDLQTVVVTKSPVAQLGAVTLQPVTEVEFQYESGASVGSPRTPGTDGSVWPSTTWILYLR